MTPAEEYRVLDGQRSKCAPGSTEYAALTELMSAAAAKIQDGGSKKKTAAKKKPAAKKPAAKKPAAKKKTATKKK
jgi:DNA topoisomerase I